tara:strand:+ start:624 stop:788 length:165 start_codon:yes stop_codon:yes gene_type:complete
MNVKKWKLAEEVIEQIKEDLKDPEFTKNGNNMDSLHEVLMKLPTKWLKYYMGVD